MLSKFVETIERRARWVLAFWTFAAVVLAVAAPSLNDVGTQDTSDFVPASAPSQRTDGLLASLFPGDPTRDASIVVIARDGGLTEADRTYLTELSTWLTGPDNEGDIRAVKSSADDPALGALLRSADGDAELLIISLAKAPLSLDGAHAVQRIRDHLEATAPKGLRHHLTGIGGLGADQIEGVISSFDRTAIVTIVLVLLILFLIYRSVVAALIPLVSIGLAFLVAQGCVSYAAQAGLKVSTLVGTFIVVMIFGAGTDYCLFLTSRYREELAARDPVATTVRRTLRVMSGVIAASAGTVIVGFGSMITAKFGIFKTMGPAVAIAVAVTLAAGVTLTPALLKLAGDRAFWPRRLDEIRTADAEASSRWDRVGAMVRAHPAEILLAGIIVLQIPAAGLVRYAPSFDLVRDIPPAADARQGFDLVSGHYPGGTISPVYLLLRTDGPILDDARLAAIDQLTEALRRQPRIGEVRSITQPAGSPLTLDNLSALTGGTADPAALGFDPATTDLGPLVAGLTAPGGLRLTGTLLHQYPQLTRRLGLLLGNDGRSTRLIIALDGNPYDSGALDAIRQIDDTANAALRGTVLSGSRIDVGGPSSFYADMRRISSDDSRVLFAVIIAAIFLVLALLLRSLVAPCFLLASVILSYAATMGITVIVFRELLGEPGITFWLGPFLFVVLVALGADYNIFIMSRIREEADAGHEIRDAVTRGLTRTGKVITSAGIILAGTFAALLIAPLPNLRQIGFGISVGILIDTFLVRSLIVPATTMLLGRWAFWPIVPHAPGTPAIPIRRRHIAVAIAGIGSLALALTLLATSGGSQPPIQVIAATDDPTTSTTTAAFEAPSSSTTAATAAPTSLAPSSTTTLAPPTALQITAPAPGTWTYKATGSKQFLGSSPRPINEDVATAVTRVGPNIRVRAVSNTLTRDDTRRYTTTGIELLATTVNASGATLGAELHPPQLLARTPIQTGDVWSGTSTAAGTTFTATGRVVGQRQAATPAGTFQCWDVQLDTTITGSSIQGDQHETACWAPGLGLPVDSTQTMSGTYNGVPFHLDIRQTLLARPR